MGLQRVPIYGIFIKTREICLPLILSFPWFFPGEASDLIVIKPKGSSRQKTLAGLGKGLMHIANRGAGGIPHVHLWAGLLPD
jgi:hypothetical protein